MTRLKIVLALALSFSATAMAQSYNKPPSGDGQFAQCLVYSATRYQGGGEPSPVPGQSKMEAWCTCMWNETPDDFKGDLAKFSETGKGAATNKLCETHANWQ